MSSQKWEQSEDINGDQSSGVTDVKVSSTRLINSNELNQIQMISKIDNLFRLIVQSFCPQIYGHQLVKSGLVLALFGGLHKHDGESKESLVRAQIHVLLMGDPGSNKDLLLKAVHSVSPNASYICGNTSRLNSLITPSAKRSRTHKHFHKGCLESKEFAICCIDEFEKMDVSQHQVIAEVMDQMKVIQYSAAIHKQISANTAIIAATNPLSGCYNWSLNVWQNTKIRKSLLSKFDLIFILVDFPDEEMDSKLSKQIMVSRNLVDFDQTSIKKNMVSQTTSCQTNDCQLMKKLDVRHDEQLDLIPPEILKQYVSYAQNYVNPSLSDEAISVLEEFYSEFEYSLISRSQTRNIETLYRLTEARARLEMRNIATEEDVLDVIDILRHSMGKQYKTPNSMNSINTKLSFKSAKKSQNAKNLLKALQNFAQRTQQKEFGFREIVGISGEYEIPFDSETDISNAVEKLNDQTFLLLTNNHRYKLID